MNKRTVSLAEPQDMFKGLKDAERDKIPSEVLAQLIEEVRNDDLGEAADYNRFHNRHNRSR